MAIRFSNNAQTTLASGITASATSITVADGSVFPTLTPGDHTYVTLEDLSGNLEVVKVTAISSNTLTVTRGQDGTTARAFSQGDFAQLRVTAALLNDLADEASVTLWADVQNKPDPVITLAGDASGSVTLTDLGNATLTVTIADDSHNHTVANVDGLQAALDAKQNASTALTTSTTFGGDVSGTYNAIVIADDSHTHDGRYYTESEADSRFVNASGDTMTGELTFQDDNEGITFLGGGRFYKQSGQGLVIRKPNGGEELRFEDNNGNYLGTFWHSGNDGASSGLDADLLDGQHGSYYYSAGNPPPYPSDADTVDGLHAASFLRSDANDTATGVITFSNVSDYQIILDGAGSHWAGIRWQDLGGYDHIWYRGSTSTFAIGGGGSTVSGKKLHVHGGLSVGTSVAGTSTPTNGIYSEGALTVPLIYGSAGNTALELNHVAYTMLSDPEGARRLYLGDSGDPGNYYDNTTHYFRDRASSVLSTISSSGLNLQVGGYQVNGTTRINSVGDGLFTSLYIGSTGIVDTNRNLTNIGTATFNGAVTMNSSLNVASTIGIAGTTIINSGRLLENVTLEAGASGARFKTDSWHQDTGGKNRFYFENTGRTFFGSGGGYVFRDSADTGRATISNYGGANLLSGGDGQVGSTVALAVGGNTVIDSSRAIFSPIYYDSNDTSRYADPNGTSELANVNVNNVLEARNGSKIIVQNSTDGGTSRGLFLWNSSDPNWGIYMSTPGAGKTIAGTTAPAGLGGLINSHAARFRVAANPSNGFIWENSSNGTLMSLQGDAGNLYTSHSVRSPIFYDSNDTSFYVDPNGTSRINVLATTGATSTFNNGRIALRADGIEDHQTAGDGGNIQVNYYGYGNGHSYFRNFDVYNGKGSFLLQANGAGNYTRVWGSLQTTSITDTDDSSFYLNPNGTSRISLLHPSAKFSPGAAYGNSLEGNELHLMDAGSASVLQDGLQFNAAAFAVPVMYARSGSTWTNIGNQPELCDGKASADWGTVTLSRSYDEFIFYFGTQFGYTIFSAVTILHSTSGNSMTIYVESSESGGATDSGWTEIVNSGDTGSWPGSTTMTCQTGVGAGYNDQFRIRIVPNWSHASNTISIGQIIVRAGYGYVRRLFDWDYNKNIEFLNNTTATTSSRAPVFYDSNDTGYYVDPNGASNILNTNHYGVLRLNSSGAYMVGDATYGFRFNNNADTINALLVDNSGNSTAYLSSRAPIFYDSNDTAYYLNAAGNGTQAANINGNIRINPKSESWAEGISFNMPSQGVWGGLRWVRNYSSPFTGNWALGYIGAESSDDMGFWSYDNSVKWRLTHAGHSIVSGSSRAPIFYDSNDTTYYVDPANSTAVYSNGVVVAGNEGFQSRYWASGVRNRIWSFYNSDTYGISYHQGSAGLSGIDSIGIHPNGSTTSAGAALSVGVYTQAIGSLRAPIFYDSDNTGLFLDPSSSSLLRNVYTQNASYAFRPRYTDGSDNYSGSFHWYGLQMGNNGANYIVAGRTNPNGYLDIYVNNTSDFPTINGTHSSRFAGDGSFRNFYSVHAPIFYDSSDTGFYVDPNSTSRIRKTNMVAVGSGWDDHLNLYSADTTNRWNVLVDQGAGNAFRIAYNQSERFNIATNGEAYFTGGLRSLIYYDRDDTGYYLDPASACRVNQINFTAYNSPNAIVVGDGDVNWTFGSYSDGSSQYWMQTKFYGTNDDNRGFRVYNVANSQVEFRINGGGVAYARDSFRAPIFYDSNNTGYYVDPASGTRLGGFVGIGGSPGSDDGNWGARLNVGGAPHARFDVICQNDGIITTMYSHTGQGVGKIGTMSNHPLALMAQNGNIGGYAYSGSLRSPIFYDSDNTGYYLDPTGSSQLNTVSLGAGSKLHLVSLGDGNHFLRYISGGFSGVSIDGPQLGGHQGGELITNYGGDNWGFRWDYSGNTFSRASSRAPIFYDSNNTGYYVDPASSSVLSTLTTYGTFSTTGNIFINNSSPTIYLQDTDNRSSMIHCNSNIFYVLRASGTNSTGWATYNGYWPMELSLETNDATFGNAITAVGNITAYSDARKKKDIRPLEGGLEYLNALDAKRYKWKVDDREDIGFIAQDVEAAGLDVFVIESERKDPDTGEHIESVKSLDYGRMVSVLWQAVKEQQTQIEAMAAEIKSLKEMKQ